MYIVRTKKRPLKRTALRRFNNRQAEAAKRDGLPFFRYLHATKGWRKEGL